MAERELKLPLLPVKNVVLFPQIETPLFVGRKKSVTAIEEAMRHEDKELIVISQKDASNDNPTEADLYRYGTKAVVRKMYRSERGMELIVQGVERVRLIEVIDESGYRAAKVVIDPISKEVDTEFEALHRTILEQADRIQSLVDPRSDTRLTEFVKQLDDPLVQVFLLASMLGLDLDKEQQILESPSQTESARIMHDYLTHEIQVLELQQKIANQIQTKLTKQQRELLLREQLETIQKELGEEDPTQSELQLLRERIEKAELPEKVRKEAERELNRLSRLPQAAPDYQLTRSYVELIAELPWDVATKDNLDLHRARTILDEDHYDLKDIKDRIVEHLAILKLNPKAKAPILCFVGPPGVGKTSLGESIARALGRQFERISLGGISDEAELRGHRRTYVGAMPGRIIQAVRRAGQRNPLIMLDEVDKLGRDFRGDPSAALMEILDPSQNFSFRDNYLDLPFDLSKVFFVTTANALDPIPRPLLDRMEVLHLHGYSDQEKVEIAKRYLIPDVIEHSGLDKEQLNLEDQTLLRLIHSYTREAGLRELGRRIGQLARKVAVQVAEQPGLRVRIGPEDLSSYLGPERFFVEQVHKELRPGVAVGLAWTPTGGDVLYVESTTLPGGKGLTLTGHLGDVMKESAKAAQSYLWTHAKTYHIPELLFTEGGVHLHVPQGAIPKDGPSAGVTMATALASAYLKRPARSDLAMTGEITLSGLVLPVGGLKEKALAAHRAGIRRILIPKNNEKDLQAFPEHLMDELEIIRVNTLDDVFLEAIPGMDSILPAPVTGDEVKISHQPWDGMRH